MQKKLWLLITGFICIPFYFATGSVDSLQMRLNSAVNDSSRIAIHLEIAQTLIAEGTKNQRNFDSILINRSLNIAAELAEKSRNTRAMGNAILGKAQFAQQREEFDSLITYANMALSITDSADDQINCRAYFILGYAYRLKGDYEKASGPLIQGSKFCEKCGDSLRAFSTLISLAELYNEQKAYAKAIELLHPYAHKMIHGQSERTRLLIFNTLAVAFKNSNMPDSAIRYYNACLELGFVKNDKMAQAILMSNIGLYYSELGDLQKALEYQYSALESAKAIRSERLIAGILINIGETYLAFNDYRKCITYTQQGLSMSGKLDKFFIREAEKNLSKAYEALSDFRQSLTHYQRFVAINDSLSLAENEKMVEELKIKYQTSQKEDEIEILTNRNLIDELVIARQRLMILIVSILTLFIITMYFILQRNYRKQKKLIELNYELGRKSKEQPSQPAAFIDHSLKDDIIARLESLLKNDKIYRNPDISLNDVATELQTNRSYLSGIINDHYKTNFNTLINNYRINDAREMLTDTENNLPIKAMALELGFSSLSAFYSSFKSITGVTPAVLREKALISERKIFPD